MNWCHREPTLEEILSEPIIRAVMEADGVDRQELEAMLRQAGRNSRPMRGGWRWMPRAMSSGQSRRMKSPVTLGYWRHAVRSFIIETP